MSRLVKNTLYAERLSGCTFSERFENVSSVVDNNGSLNGDPKIKVGADLDGSLDSIEYSLTGAEFYSDNLSIVFEFTPRFGVTADAHYFFDCNVGARTTLVKNSPASSNQITLILGNSTFLQIAQVTYEPFWRTNERNVFVISTVSGNTKAWLNGGLVKDDQVSTWSKKSATRFYCGVANTGSSPFDGIIHSFKLFNTLLTEEDAQRYYAQTVFKYKSASTVDLPMCLRQHDPTGVDAVTNRREVPYNLLKDGDMEDNGYSDERLTNGDFRSWTGDNPNDWTIEGTETGGSFVTEPVGGSACRIVSDGSYIGVSQYTCETGKVYRVTFNVIEVDTDFVVYIGASTNVVVDSVGAKVIDIKASADEPLRIVRNFSTGAVDFTISDVTLKEVTNQEWPLAAGAVFITKESDSYSGNQALQIADAGSSGSAGQTALTVGKKYRTGGWAYGDSANGIPNIGNNGNGLSWVGQNLATWQQVHKEFLVFAGSSATSYRPAVSGGSVLGSFARFDELELYELLNLVVDGDMRNSDADAWPEKGGATVTKEAEDGVNSLRVTGGVNSYANQIGATVGRLYFYAGKVRSDGSAIPEFYGARGPQEWTGTASTEWQYFSLISGGVATTTRIVALLNKTAGYTEWGAIFAEEVKPSTLDLSREKNNFSFGDNITSSTFPTKLPDKGYSFDGTQYMSLAYPALNAVDDWTMSAYVNPATTATTQAVLLNGNSSLCGYGIFVLSGNWVVLYPGVIPATVAAVTVGQWQHVVATRRSGTLYVYIDGVEYTKTSLEPNEPICSSTSKTTIGSNQVFGDKFTGSISDVLFLDQSLTSLQVQDLYAHVTKRGVQC